MGLRGGGGRSGKTPGHGTGADVERADGYESLSENLFKIQTLHVDQ